MQKTFTKKSLAILFGEIIVKGNLKGGILKKNSRLKAKTMTRR